MTPMQKIALYVAIIIGSLTLLVAGLVLVFFAGTEIQPGSEHWCEELLLLPHEAWKEEDYSVFATECLDPVPVIY